MRSTKDLVWRTLIAHPLRSILTALAITLGVAMVIAASTVGQAANRSASELAGEPRIDLEVLAAGGAIFADDVLEIVRQLPYVAQATPLLRLDVSVVSPPISSLTLLGVESASYRALHELQLTHEAFLTGPDSIVMPILMTLEHSLAVGDELSVRRGQQSAVFTLSDRLQASEGSGVASTPVGHAFVSLPSAQQLAGFQGRIDRIEISLMPGMNSDDAENELQVALPAGLSVVPAASGDAASGNVAFVQIALAMVGSILLLVAGFVILNAFAMSITGRMRELGALRTMGMTRGQIRRMVLAEAAVLGGLGTAAGLPVGLGLAWLTMQLMGTLEEVPFTVPWWGILTAVALGIAITLLAALQPALRASRVPPILAVRAQATEATENWYLRWGGRLGLALLVVLLLGFAFFSLFGSPTLPIALGLMVVGQGGLLLAAILLLPVLISIGANLARPILIRWLSTPGRLAADNLIRNKLRTILTAGALIAVLTMVIATSGFMAAGFKGAFNRLDGLVKEDAFIAADVAALVASGDLTFENFFQYISRAEGSLDLNPPIRALQPMVDQELIQVERNRFVPIPAEWSSMPGAPGNFVELDVFLPIGSFDFFEGETETALAMAADGPVVLLPPGVAEQLGAGVGDTLPLQTPHGQVDFVVAGIGGSGWNLTIFNYPDAETYFDATSPTHLGIVVSEDADVDQALAEVDEVLSNFPDLALQYPYDSLTGLIDRLTLLLNGFLLLAVVVAALGIINTMVINVTERQREIGLLRAVGATAKQVRQMIVFEAAVLGLLSAVVAAILGLLLLLIYALLVPHVTGSMGIRGNWETIQVLIGAGLRDWALATAVSLFWGPLVAAAAAYYPARQAAAVDVITATRGESISLKRSEGSRQRRPSRPRLTRSMTWTMAWRSLQENRLRTVLSGLAVSFGAAMVIAADMVSDSLLKALTESDVEGLEITHGFIAEQFEVFLSLIGYVLVAAAGFLVFNAFAMTVTQRQQQIGALRALGATRRQVMRLVMVEALILGGAGAVVGLVAGPLLGQGVVLMMRIVAGEFLTFAEGSVSGSAVFLAASLSIGITLVSVLLPARRASRVSPLAALRPQTSAGIDRPRTGTTIAGLVTLLGIALFLLITPPGRWANPPWNIYLTGIFLVAWLAGWILLLPAITAASGRLLKKVWRQSRATGRLIGDNIRRGQGRVTLTILTMAIGLLMIVGLTGFMTFTFDELFGPALDQITARGTWAAFPFDLAGGILSVSQVDSILLPEETLSEIHEEMAGRAAVAEFHFVFVPELSFLGDTYFSYVLDPEVVRQEPSYFSFSEGNWEQAMPIMQAGCGLLVTPAVAQRNGVALYDAIGINSNEGPMTCTVAGIGPTFMSASIISNAVSEAFDLTTPLGLAITPYDDTDPGTFDADMAALDERLPDVWMTRLTDYVVVQERGIDIFIAALNGLLLLAVLAAALGIVNTTVISVNERRQELGLIRAVGATRRQTKGIVVGEATLMGMIGGLFGLAAGLGAVIITVVTYGGRSWGITEMDLWAVVGRTLPPAIRNGFVGLVAIPVISGLAAYWPTRAVVKGTPLQTMETFHRPESPLRVMGLLSRGSIRTRLVLGTLLLLALLLFALTAVVTGHAGNYLEDQVSETMATMVQGNASMIELTLPPEATALTPDALQADSLDPAMLLRFRSLIDELGTQGFIDFVVTDQDGVVIFSFDANQVGTLMPSDLGDRANASVQKLDDQRLMTAFAPIRNEDGQTLGSVRLTLELAALDDFERDLRYTLWGVGAFFLGLGMALSWLIGTPLVRATRRLSTHAALVGQGSFEPFTSSRGRLPRFDFSVRTRLTAALLFAAVLMVFALALVVIPVERRKTEQIVLDTTRAATEWAGQALSMALAEDALDLGQLSDFNQASSLIEGMDLGRLQELNEQLENENVAYSALINEEGIIQFSDQFGLLGEEAGLPAQTKVEESDWRNEPIWRITTPITEGEGGEQIGALQIGLRQQGIDLFLDESRNLFQLAGIMAMLASVLLAQVIGGAIAAPIRRMAADVRRVGRGDMEVQFDSGSRDELTVLAQAFNEMVAGIREREWLRDIFGRFVSQEVAEAIQAGQVRLDGERRVVSVLFCDIRDFTARSARSTPEEVVNLLNRYLLVVIDAAQHHDGTVNKFAGDSTLIIYGAPRPMEESAHQALLTALEMRRDLTLLNQRLAEEGHPPIRIGVGIDTGTVLAGAVGPPERQEYTVIGDTVNLASRLQALNKEYGQHDIFISGRTYEALGGGRGEFSFIDLGRLQIRGKDETVQVWAVES